MSQFTADTLMPIISALPESERYVLQEKLAKMLTPRKLPRRKKDIFDRIGDKYRPENREILVAEIMNAK